MPWLAIPQDDKESRTKLFSMVGSDRHSLIPILDYDKGEIVDPDAIPVIECYGAEGYPFTPERIRQIDEEDWALRYTMSVKEFLTSPTRDFLIRSNFEKVPVSDLQGKVVAFYFYMGSETRTVDYLRGLHKTLRRMGVQFEVVFLYSRGAKDERSFMEDLEKMPWLGLPFNDRIYLKLRRIFRCNEGDLVIVAPGHSVPDTFGLDVITHYGIEAYPFTRQTVIDMEVERLKSLTLESLLCFNSCKYLQSICGNKITAHHLVNKTVLLLFTNIGNPVCHDIVSRMATWYCNIKNKTGDVEIIHILYDELNRANPRYFPRVPWLQFPCDARYEDLFRKRSDLYCSMPVVIAYGADGEKSLPWILCTNLYPMKTIGKAKLGTLSLVLISIKKLNWQSLKTGCGLCRGA